ncbi:hypothetical protein MAR_035066 [Mya arenaria]|uniref:Uncharacterized protein n=1 Tax=Mya arenaria TaxID=6604 RepID=A0ABY7EJF0_MYAAR|nr:hypothetical protein MAR_035066 [Mya arenaria]
MSYTTRLDDDYDSQFSGTVYNVRLLHAYGIANDTTVVCSLANRQSSRLRLGKPEIKASNIQQFRPEFTLKEMFTAACYQFVKSIGKTTLHATPSLDEKDNVKMFQLVVKTKRRSFIFWEKSDFRPTEFQLTDVMMVQKPLGISTQQTDLVSEFNRTSKVSLKGKIGAEISKEILDKDLEQVRNIFAGITSMDDKTRAELNKKLFELMKIPRDLVLLSDLVDETEKGKQLSLTLIDLANKLISPQDGEDLKPPHQSDPALAMYGELLDAASMLDDEMMDMVSTFPPHCAQPMLTLLAEGMKGREVKDPSVLKAVLSDPTSMKMLLDLEFRLENDVIDAPVELPYTIDEVYWLIFALYGK